MLLHSYSLPRGEHTGIYIRTQHTDIRDFRETDAHLV